ncbi:hypothetical protein CDAR_538971 [Caerostris darwini]|uniref:Uncharacterized protein n=1 Tax=Caerostris darwini TaxID=1538125 RepID=A0AAV4SZQ0_9ARAC|nr:hypothetical protein CDAR_538971 [Caerostris darwini]
MTTHPEYRLVINTRIDPPFKVLLFQSAKSRRHKSAKYVRNSKTPTDHAKHEKEKRWGGKNIPPKIFLGTEGIPMWNVLNFYGTELFPCVTIDGARSAGFFFFHLPFIGVTQNRPAILFWTQGMPGRVFCFGGTERGK